VKYNATVTSQITLVVHNIDYTIGVSP